MGRTGYEPVTSSVSGKAIPSDTVVRRRVTAARHDSAVVVRRVVAGDAWRRCHWRFLISPAVATKTDLNHWHLTVNRVSTTLRMPLPRRDQVIAPGERVPARSSLASRPTAADS